LLFGSAVVFNNRLLLTANPQATALGVFHDKLIALNLDPVSSLRAKAPPAYDGVWTGLNILQVMRGKFVGRDLCFAFCLSADLTAIELWEIQATEGPNSGITETTLDFQSGTLNFYQDDPRIRDCLRLLDGEIYVDKMTELMGCGSSGKTHEAAWVYLCEYFCFPEETLVLVSSTDMRGLRLRIWGELSSLWQRAIDKYDYLPGNLLDSRIAITTDALEDSDYDDVRRVRDMRKGIIGIPTIMGGKQVGLGKWQGVKQKRVRLIADEAALMGPSFLSAFSNLNNNTDFRAVVIGNPVDVTDPLGIAAEPIDGWGTVMDTEKTIVWDTRFMNGRCVNLIGTDSPNFDYPENEKTRFPYLISRQKIKEILSGFTKDSPEYYSQCVGSMKISQMARRVITRLLCRKYEALEQPVWRGTGRTKIASLDAAYGGDRCMIGWGEFGPDANGKDILAAYPPVVVPIVVGKDDVEDQISKFVKRFCEDNGVPPENFFHDSTGRGSLGTSLARWWSNACNPVEFGGKPTTRPVSLDMFVMDEETKVRRHKLSFEHYYNFVSELWYAVRYTIEAGQLRALSEDVMDEGCKREWDWVPKGGMKVIQVEPKELMKERTRQSPDQFDQLAILVEGARRRGFQISKLANSSTDVDEDALDADEEAYLNTIKKSLLQREQEQYAMA
jgi:hypothetical protein